MRNESFLYNVMLRETRFWKILDETKYFFYIIFCFNKKMEVIDSNFECKNTFMYKNTNAQLNKSF